MSSEHPPPTDLDPDTFRELGYRTIDIIADYYASIEDRPVYVQAAPSTEFGR